jgi:3-phosphoshikimate 1-carboxyvinyltransferase
LTAPDTIAVHLVGPVTASVRVPGSKSHTNRSLVIAMLAGGTSTLEGALFADDTRAMIAALGTLGFEVESDEETARVTVEGLGGRIPAEEATVDARDAGTVMRFLTGVLAAGEGRFTVDGSVRMRERPIGDLVKGLRQLGATIATPVREGYPPVEIAARGLEGGTAKIAASTSSQFVTAILLAAPCARSPVTLELAGEVVSRPFITLTEDLMREFGVEVVHVSGGGLRVDAPARYRAGKHVVQGDATAATYFWAAAAVTGGRVMVENVGADSFQGDAKFVEVLERMGCRVTHNARSAEVAFDGGQGERLVGGTFDLNSMPDAAPTLAVVAAFADGPTEIVNVANLRVKECDRLAALAAELPKLGVRVEERPDSLLIVPPEGGAKSLRGARIATYHDHRMAMSFAVAGLAVPGIEIENPACVEKTYPRFFDDLSRLSAG